MAFNRLSTPQKLERLFINGAPQMDESSAPRDDFESTSRDSAAVAETVPAPLRPAFDRARRALERDFEALGEYRQKIEITTLSRDGDVYAYMFTAVGDNYDGGEYKVYDAAFNRLAEGYW